MQQTNALQTWIMHDLDLHRIEVIRLPLRTKLSPTMASQCPANHMCTHATTNSAHKLPLSKVDNQDKDTTQRF